jgi:tetratricopeptide (TPR) repeat protein
MRAVTLTLLLLLASTAAHAQQRFVYRVKISDCAGDAQLRIQTAFRIAERPGLVTALHGVIGCNSITAISEAGGVLTKPLKVEYVDVDHDAAILQSDELRQLKAEGIAVARDVKWNALGTVKAYGHPFGMYQHDQSLSVRDPPLRPLIEELPATPEAREVVRLLLERNSPKRDVRVLSLQGHLVPGHSGAPVLDSRGRVVAIANGGLERIGGDFSWAIALTDVVWKTMYEARLEYNRLLALKLDGIFLFDRSSYVETLSTTTPARELTAQEHLRLGLTHFENLLYDQAREEFASAIRVDEKLADAFFWSAKTWTIRPRRDVNDSFVYHPSMKAYFERYLELAPDGQYADEAKGWLRR